MLLFCSSPNIGQKRGNMKGIGTIINVLAVLLGGGAGLMLKNYAAKAASGQPDTAGTGTADISSQPGRYQEILMHALGISTIFIGISGTLKGMFSVNGNALEASGSMLLIITLVLGSIAGEWIDIEKWMDHFGVWLRQKFGGRDDNQFVEGFVSASLVICVGAMAIVGALEDGLQGNPSTLIAKAILDAVIVMVFASSYGKGALFSAIPVGLWQGGITLFARFLEPLLTDAVISDLSFVGNALIFCVGINLAFGKRFRVGNMLPALVFVVLFDWLQNWIPFL